MIWSGCWGRTSAACPRTGTCIGTSFVTYPHRKGLRALTGGLPSSSSAWFRGTSCHSRTLAAGRSHSATQETCTARLHQVDRDASGRIEVPHGDVVNSGSRERYLMNSLIEEAITSSQLEGAVTTRRVAKELLRSGRPPRDNSERMIVNNYSGMEFLRENIDEDLTVSMFMYLQRTLTEGTLDPDAVGRLRRLDRLGRCGGPARRRGRAHAPGRQLSSATASNCSWISPMDAQRTIHSCIRSSRPSSFTSWSATTIRL